MTATLSRRTGIYMSSQSSYNDANDKLVSNNHPQLEGKMWTIFPTDLKCRVHASLSSPQLVDHLHSGNAYTGIYAVGNNTS